jgi:hypothetical protein
MKSRKKSKSTKKNTKKRKKNSAGSVSSSISAEVALIIGSIRLWGNFERDFHVYLSVAILPIVQLIAGN